MTVAQQWNAEAGAISDLLLCFVKRVFRIGEYVCDLHWLSLQCHTPQNAAPARLKDNITSNFTETGGKTVCRNGTKIGVTCMNGRQIRIAKLCG